MSFMKCEACDGALRFLFIDLETGCSMYECTICGKKYARL